MTPETAPPYHPSRVLVTGAAGRLGREVTHLLASRGIAVTALDRGRDLPDETRQPEPGWDRFVTGSASDPGAVTEALDGVDGVIHTAALPTPDHGTPEEVFAGNSAATFTVLDRAGRLGVQHAVVSSSVSVLGMPFAPEPVAPAYLPVDTGTPLAVADPYALSKQADEASAAMVTRRYGMTTTALRFPRLGYVDGGLAEEARHYAAHPADGARSLWAYLDFRDAARACLLALTRPGPGAHVLFLAAPTTLAAEPTRELVRRYLPQSRTTRDLPGRTVPIDLSAAGELLGFAAEFEVAAPAV